MNRRFDNYPQKSWRSQYGRLLLCTLVALLSMMVVQPKLTAKAQTSGTNLALNKPATSSSNENAGVTPNLAVDDNLGTRWSSAFSDPQWLQIDLGAVYSVNHVKLTWEAAYGKSYQIQVSNDALNWTTLYSTTTGDGGVDDLTGLVGSGRYIRMVGTVRATGYGYSLWEFEVYGPTATPTNTPVPPTATATTVSSGCGTTNVALNRPATSSSNENAGTPPSLAVDGNLGTRWSSAYSDPQWLQIDLGSMLSICHVKLTWEAAYGKSYQIQVSNDAANWTTIYSTTTGDGGVDDLTGLSGTGRYIRMYGTVRGTAYGYSLWEFEVYTGSTVPTNTPVATNTATKALTFTPTATNTATATRTSTATATAIATTTACGTTNVALNRPATSSSNENAGVTPNLAVDGNTGTRWASAFSDPQWIQIDLGASMNICHVKLTWEAAYGKSYQIQVSADGTLWANLYSTTTGDGGVDDLTGLSGNGRYIRMYGTVRATGYGYSLWEFEVYSTSGSATSTPVGTISATPTSGATATFVPPTATSTGCPATNFALNRPVTASSVTGTNAPNLAVDGNTGTRWESAFSDPQWIRLDFGTTATFCRVRLNWETAAASAFQLQTSNDGVNWTSIYSTTTGTGGVQDLTVSGSGRYLRMYGTARTTAYGYSLWEFEAYGTGGVVIPTATPTPTPDATFWGDTSSIPPAQNVMMFKFLNRTNGKYPDSQVFWSFNGQTHSIAEQPYFDMTANSSGRMYFYLGDPATTPYWDFIEFTIGPADFNGNTTRVDGFGLKLAIRLHTKDGFDQAVGEDIPTFQEDRAVTFQKFINEVPTEFKHLAQEQAPYRIPAPAHAGDTDFTPAGPYAHYFDSYLAAMGSTATTDDVFGCTNTLGADSGKCASFNRHVAQLPQSQWFDTTQYYLSAPANYYAKFWHDHGLGGLAYGFPYDDYANQAAYMSRNNPQWLLVAIGW